MPPVERDESIDMGKQLMVDEESVKDNFLYTSGITRYLFERGAEKNMWLKRLKLWTSSLS
jgi:hypothetical protein